MPSEPAAFPLAHQRSDAVNKLAIFRIFVFSCLVGFGTIPFGRAEPKPVTLVTATPEHPRNDSATAVELSDGSLLLVWMEFVGGPLAGNDEAPNRLSALYSRDGGHTWGEKRTVVEPSAGERNVYNPSLVRLGDGSILLCYHAYNELEWMKPMRSSGFAIAISADGRIWGQPRRIWDHLPYGPANNNLVRLRSGRLIRGVESAPVWGQPVMAGALISDDEGRSWRTSVNWVHLPLRGVMESHIAELRSGALVMALRTDLGAVFLSRSRDRGTTWSKPQTSGLGAPESMPVLVTLPSTGDLALIWNHGQYDPDYNHFGKRTPLTCAVSQDGGVTWGHVRDIETDPGVEFSNPSCNFFSGGKAIITYFASPMVKADPPGKFGRTRMDLKILVVDESWFYQISSLPSRKGRQ